MFLTAHVTVCIYVMLYILTRGETSWERNVQGELTKGQKVHKLLTVYSYADMWLGSRLSTQWPYFRRHRLSWQLTSAERRLNKPKYEIIGQLTLTLTLSVYPTGINDCVPYPNSPMSEL